MSNERLLESFQSLVEQDFARIEKFRGANAATPAAPTAALTAVNPRSSSKTSWVLGLVVATLMAAAAYSVVTDRSARATNSATNTHSDE